MLEPVNEGLGKKAGVSVFILMLLIYLWAFSKVQGLPGLEPQVKIAAAIFGFIVLVIAIPAIIAAKT